MEVIGQRNTEKAIRNIRRSIVYSVATYVVVMSFLTLLNLLTSPGYMWVLWPALGWGLGLVLGIIGKYQSIDRLNDEQ